MKTEGYKVKSYSQPVKRYCQTLSLRDNPELIEAYRKAHSKEESWPEIRAGIREVGILEMEIYILGSKLFMIVETPLNFDWDKAMAKLATLPCQAEWRNMWQISAVCRGSHIGREMADDGTYVLSV